VYSAQRPQDASQGVRTRYICATEPQPLPLTFCYSTTDHCSTELELQQFEIATGAFYDVRLHGLTARAPHQRARAGGPRHRRGAARAAPAQAAAQEARAPGRASARAPARPLPRSRAPPARLRVCPGRGLRRRTAPKAVSSRAAHCFSLGAAASCFTMHTAQRSASPRIVSAWTEHDPSGAQNSSLRASGAGQSGAAGLGRSGLGRLSPGLRSFSTRMPAAARRCLMGTQREAGSSSMKRSCAPPAPCARSGAGGLDTATALQRTPRKSRASQQSTACNSFFEQLAVCCAEGADLLRTLSPTARPLAHANG